jgi:hypothetical protein
VILSAVLPSLKVMVVHSSLKWHCSENLVMASLSVPLCERLVMTEQENMKRKSCARDELTFRKLTRT